MSDAPMNRSVSGQGYSLDDRPVIAVTASLREIDNGYDWKREFRSIVAAGAIPLTLPTDATGLPIEHIIGHVDGVIMLGGGDVDPIRYGGDPEDPLISGVDSVRDQNEFDILDAARQLNVPVLTICHSTQLLNVYLGGTLYPDISRDRPGSLVHNPGLDTLAHAQHVVRVEEETALARWLGGAGDYPVNSQHHQGIRELGAGARISARTSDGLIEGIESLDGRIVGVQWHPEFMLPTDESAARILQGFLGDVARVHAP